MVMGTDIPFDFIWCPVCSRQIVPKRIHIPLPPAQPTVPALDAAPHYDPPRARVQRKASTTRPPGLVHCTRRAKPNGATKRSPLKNDPTPTEEVASPPKSTGPVRHRTIIDQTPAPLYCSDECRLADLQSSYHAIHINYRPGRCGSTELSDFRTFAAGSQDSDASSESSVESRASALAPPTTAVTTEAIQPVSSPEADAYARLAKICNFRPLPPAPPLLRRPAAPAAPPANLDDGAMTGARLIQAALFPEKRVKSAWGAPCFKPARAEKPIPGWTDGSNAWRASVYGLAPPRDFTLPGEDEAAKKAYGSYVASPHRSRGVHSTLGEKPDLSVSVPRSVATRAIDASTLELYAKYSASFTRRAESRNAGCRHSSNSSASVREVSILKPGAEGLLLVPDVKLKRVSSAMSYTDSRSTTETQAAKEEDAILETCSLPATGRRMRQIHTWSYSEDTLTYPIPCDPPKIEKRVVRRVVDGVEQDVEIEVKVYEPLKRLFLFPSAVDRR